MSPLNLTPTPHDLSTLTHLSSLLHLAHHRNSNQHRRAAWYRPFSLLRRHLSRLLKLYTTLLSVPDSFSARHKKKSQDRITTVRIQEELEFMRDVLFPRAWRGFSQLVADGRFAVLGTVLLAVLGEMGRVTGVTRGMEEEEAQREVERVLERCGGEWEDAGGGLGGEEDVGMVVGREGEEGDVGEVVEREDGEGDVEGVAKDVRDETVEQEAKEPKSLPQPVMEQKLKKRKVDDAVKVKDKAKKRKKREGGDAIDDLFAGL
ncbi:hypothetical protein BDZ85DRAFT_298638 [Elsinoe ampelina]|uniref:RNase MRP protein 1 RNA binding domain-containing protein n=1 Tax=Elsinoe ampelina TaxID=302913 RepID=A0A6A6G1X1_9PEZI|nr:hypothetical protein BDZ85DRAFT_298638 [Elsinoe ampelina]